MPDTRTDEQRRLMPHGLRYAIFAVFGGVWLTGMLWLLAHTILAVPDEFGVVRHPWEGNLLTMHGVLSIALAYVCGWVLARHATEAWRAGKRRVSGGLFTLVLAVLSFSGFLLFFVSSDAWQARSAGVHEAVGVFITLLAVEHWRVLNRPSA